MAMFWGTGSSAVQVEGANPADDWFSWERAGHAPKSGQGNGFSPSDLTLLADWGFTDHRLSVSWARIQPTPDTVDTEAIRYYRNVLETGNAAGLRMWITLLHTAIPAWFAERGGFAGPDVQQVWMRWVALAAEHFGDLAGGWMPVNNPLSFANKGYLSGTFPPGVRDREQFATVLATVHMADFEAALLLRQGGRPTCSNESLVPLFPASPTAEPATAQLDEAMWSWLHLAWHDRYTDAFDHHGFSYYCAASVSETGAMGLYPPNSQPGPLGYVPWADGLAITLDRLAAELPGKSLVVSELGYGGPDDDARARYLKTAIGHLDERVDGVFLWTGIDNYEWLRGYDVPFGLFDLNRRPRGSAHLVRELLRARSAS
ncbi:glycoside hydrolase family 1 protein [Pseudonocardiaceae bacterium YIM PH 21723]|nr:glycoside hydrolase family 1 protein [Pseudonocardiaceae bacterium YIM PH 21723]